MKNQKKSSTKKKKKAPSEKAKERRARRKIRSRRLEENQRTNWVEDTLRWVPSDEYHLEYAARVHDQCDGDNEVDHDDGDDEDHHVEDIADGGGNGSDSNDDEDDDGGEITSTNDVHPTDSDSDTYTDTATFSIISWNVLADAYCNRSSHKDLPPKFQRRVFDRKQRRHHVQQTLRRIVVAPTDRQTGHAEQDRQGPSIVKSSSRCGDDLDRNVQRDKNRSKTTPTTATATATATTTTTMNYISPDVLALQEVDPPLGVAACLKEYGYECVETAGTKGGRVGRVDSCGLYYKQDAWTCLEHETVFLDDLATSCCAHVRGGNQQDAGSGSSSHSTTVEKKKPTTTAKMNENLRGLQTSLARKNVALLVKLCHKPTGRHVVVANAHFFWNPAYEYVKLCQAHYVSCRAKAFCGHEQLPIVFCGDFNSQPNSHVHRYFVEGSVNAKLSAPWYACALKPRDESWRRQEDDVAAKKSQPDEKDLEEKLRDLSLDDKAASSVPEEQMLTPPIRYMVDFTLNRFCRWLRILGIDAEIEKEHEEIERTKEGKFVVIDRCIREGRCLVTTSTKLLKRKDCPAGAYLVDVRCSLEETLVHLLLSHGVQLQPSKILTRCVVCNGSFIDVHDDEKKREIFKSQQAPDVLNDQELDVYECNGCGQGFWWCEKPNSSASRVKSQAIKLLEICIAGGVKVSRKLGLFEGCVDIDRIQFKQSTLDTSWALERLSVVEWLQNEHLENPLLPMKSAYANPNDGCESVPFTNVTSDFVGHLDWVMYQTDSFEVKEVLHIPHTFEELNDFNIPNGHLLPSYDWPSDHLAVGAKLSFLIQDGNTSVDSRLVALSSVVDSKYKAVSCVVQENMEEDEKKDSLETEPPSVLKIQRDMRMIQL